MSHARTEIVRFEEVWWRLRMVSPELSRRVEELRPKGIVERLWMLGFLGRATTYEIHVDGREIESARWFTRTQMREETASGGLVLPGGVSISRSLVEHWYGGPLPGSW